MSKRNVAFIKPEEPAFLKRIKEQIGYKEGPSVDTKRQKLEDEYQSGDDDYDEEAPQVVVLKEGDLTAEQAEAEKQRLEKGECEYTMYLVLLLTNIKTLFFGVYRGSRETS